MLKIVLYGKITDFCMLLYCLPFSVKSGPRLPQKQPHVPQGNTNVSNGKMLDSVLERLGALELRLSCRLI